MFFFFYCLPLLVFCFSISVYLSISLSLNSLSTPVLGGIGVHMFETVILFLQYSVSLEFLREGKADKIYTQCNELKLLGEAFSISCLGLWAEEMV